MLRDYFTVWNSQRSQFWFCYEKCWCTTICPWMLPIVNSLPLCTGISESSVFFYDQLNSYISWQSPRLVGCSCPTSAIKFFLGLNPLHLLIESHTAMVAVPIRIKNPGQRTHSICCNSDTSHCSLLYCRKMVHVLDQDPHRNWQVSLLELRDTLAQQEI